MLDELLYIVIKYAYISPTNSQLDNIFSLICAKCKSIEYSIKCSHAQPKMNVLFDGYSN